jgi:hypothetical protein
MAGTEGGRLAGGRGAWIGWGLVALLAVGLGAALSWEGRGGEDDADSFRPHAPAAPAPGRPAPTPVVEASEDEVKRACASCHALPDPGLFPKSAWPKEVERGFGFLAKAGGLEGGPSRESVTAFYQGRAPEAWDLPPSPPSDGVAPVALGRLPLSCRDAFGAFSVANVRFAELSPGEGPCALACDMNEGRLLRAALKPEFGPLKVIARDLGHPAHVEDCDLDRDGIRDLVVADLGVFYPSDNAQGRVIWLRGKADRSFEPPAILATGLGRVSDVRPADFDGDGDLDLIVAVFGWHDQGEILLLVNRGGAEGHLAFDRKQVDPRHGAIHVPAADLDGDGRMDFVAAISQEYETVEAFLNDGAGGFRRETIFDAGMPSFGLSGIRLVDLDKDGDLDVLMTNGDVLDTGVMRAEHGVHWLENAGSYPFKHRKLAALYGAAGAAAGDIDGDGDLDVVAGSFLPDRLFAEERKRIKPDGLILLVQERPGEFRRVALAAEPCLYPSCDLGDADGDGDLDLLVGYCDVYPPLPASRDWIALWKNEGGTPPP